MHDRKQFFYDYAVSMLGLPYRYGGNDTIDGFDCSGFVIEMLKSVGILPHRFDTTAAGLLKAVKGSVVETPHFGSLIFYGVSSKDVRHVALALDSALIIEAGGGGAETLTRDDASTHDAYIRMRPRRYRNDLVKIIHPYYPWGF